VQQGQEDNELAIAPWEPSRYIKNLSSHEAKLTRGFLQSEPQKWFPGFAVQWIPMAHSFGVEFKVKGVKPELRAPKGLNIGFVGTIDDETVGILTDENSAKALVNALSPGASAAAQNVMLEYLARRLLQSLALSWSGPESTQVLFDTSLNPSHVREAGAVCLELSVNSQNFSIWILLGKFAVERLDALWRKQVRSTSKQNESGAEVSLEVAQLAVPPSMLSEYMKPQAIIDLEVVVSDRLILRTAGKARSVAQMCNVEGKLGIEMTDAPIPNPKLPEGTTRMAIEFGRMRLDASQLSELDQPGSVLTTEIPTSSEVNLVINEEKVGTAELMVYEGRFAMQVK